MFSPGEGDNCTEKLVTRFLGLGDLSVMTKSSKKNEDLKPDPQRGDAILKRMLQTKPKPHKEMKKGGKGGTGKSKK